VPRSSTTWATKLSHTDRDAIIKAAVVDEISSREIAARAAAGTLPGCSKVDISDSYVRKLTARFKSDYTPAKLAEPGVSDQARADARNRMLAVILSEIDKWEKQARAGQPDLPQHGRLMRALAEHDKAPTRAEQHEPGTQEETGQDQPPDLQGLLAGLLERTKTDSNGQSNDDTEPLSPARAVSPGDTDAA